MSDREDFEAWAREHLGIGYSLEIDEGCYSNKVTRWAFKAWKAAVLHERERMSKPRNAFAEAAAMQPVLCANCDGMMVGNSNGHNAFLRCEKCHAVPEDPYWDIAAIPNRKETT